MAEQAGYANPRKRKRRRRQDKPAIKARLVLDDHVKGDIGILSEDLFKDLFPAFDQGNLYSTETCVYSD
jgi:peroxin-6